MIDKANHDELTQALQGPWVASFVASYLLQCSDERLTVDVDELLSHIYVFASRFGDS